MSEYHRRVNAGFVNVDADLPYGLTVEEVMLAVGDIYTFFDDVNGFLVSKGYGVIESIILGNSYSGIVSEVAVRSLSERSETLSRNMQIGGHPALIPTGTHSDDKVLKGTEGVEVKSSKQKGGWQGHNPEETWLMVFRYNGDCGPDKPLEFVEVLVAHLGRDDWSFSGRKGTSRRTPTASILKSGVAKLRANPIYRNPAFEVNSGKRKRRSGSDNEVSGRFDFG